MSNLPSKSNKPRFNGSSIKVTNFMCFGNEAQGFEEILPINLIIGRNNAGKTALIEMLSYLIQSAKTQTAVPGHLFHGNVAPDFHIATPISMQTLPQAYPNHMFIGAIQGPALFEQAKRFLGQSATVIFDSYFRKKAALLPEGMPIPPEPQLSLLASNPVSNKRFLRLSSERDIEPESSASGLFIYKNGRGATRILHEIRNSAKYARLQETKEFLTELNKITEPDLRFAAFDVKKDQNDAWEIYLTEEGKEPIQLSSLGSGLKTIILVLLNLHFMPILKPENEQAAIPPIEDHVFAFEEIENFLHPAIQRRLLTYLRDFALNKGCTIFISSHSNISIDMFSKDPSAQIIHVTSDGKTSRAERTTTYLQHKGIIDDLDVRASDLLQSNGVIWVEGPSDRIYLNHWIELMSGGELREGAHYQVVFYGGRLLSHLTCAEPDEINNLVNILRVNRNAAIVIDSDKRAENSTINQTKERLVQEITGGHGIAWVTEGKEIENYIPQSVLNKMYPQAKINPLDKYSDLFTFLDTIEAGQGEHFRGKKPMLAERATEYFVKEDLSNSLDLTERLTTLCDEIRKWNNMGSA